jgi:glycosyltransferase involved in cell wall biosynthesis
MKKKILIASVLKPVNDVRMYEKFALSVVKFFSEECEIHILGAVGSEQPSENIFFHPIADFDRLNRKRWAYHKIFFQTVIQLKPNLLIINSPELLLPSLFIKVRLKTPIIYDVRENYFRNIWYQNTYPPHLRFPLALIVRSLEYLSRFWIDFYLLAERNYEKEFYFSKGKSEVIENKYKMMPPNSNTQNKAFSNNNLIQTFLYTGTISHTYGTLRAIRFIKKIRHYLPQSQLLIKGFCSDSYYLEWLQKEVQGANFIHLEISERPVQHQEIIASFARADAALLPYLPNKSTENCIPAKMYEYIAHQLPMVVQENPLWKSICTPCKAALFVDFEAIITEKAEVGTLVEHLKTYPFYSEGSRDFAFWEESEEKKFIKLMKKYVHING